MKTLLTILGLALFSCVLQAKNKLEVKDFTKACEKAAEKSNSYNSSDAILKGCKESLKEPLKIFNKAFKEAKEEREKKLPKVRKQRTSKTKNVTSQKSREAMRWICGDVVKDKVKHKKCLAKLGLKPIEK